MKRVKRLFGDLIAAAISLLILASAFALPFEAVKAAPTAAGPAQYSEPCKGAGRDASSAAAANGQLTIDNGQLTMSPHPSAAPTPVSSADSVGRGSDSPPDCHSLPRQALRYPQGEGLDQGEGVTSTEEEYVEAEAVAETEYVEEVMPEREDPPAGEIDALIREAAERYGLPWELVSAVCYVESGYDPNAVSGTPDYGLMQVTQSVMGSYGLTADNWMDPAANLDAGCRILREKIDESGGDFTIALMKYNEGDAGYLENIAAGIWSTKYTEDVLGKYYQILREGR